MADINTGTLIHQGVLIKSPPESKSKDLGRWRKRYFKLWSTKKLEYYKNEKSDKPLKKPIDLSRCKSIDGDLKNKKWSNIFCVNTEYRKFFLVADSPECMRDWIKKLCDICGFSEEVAVSSTHNAVNANSPSTTPFDSPSCRQTSTSSGDMQPGALCASPRDSPSIPPGSPDEDLSYDRELPPLPSSSSESNGSATPRDTDSPQQLASSPFSSHIKQTRSNVYTDSPSPCYDMVPKPRLAVDDTLTSQVIPRRRVSTPSESALKNMTINDESYVDMQADPSKLDSNAQIFSATLRPQASSYDTVPPPRPALTGKMATYDVVPKPRPKSDEYITCEINDPSFKGNGNTEVPPPVPDQTYTGFETLPDDRSLLQRPMKSPLLDIDRNEGNLEQHLGNDIYDVPPTEESRLNDIYDVPPTEGSLLSQLIYDTPPVQDSNIDYAANSGGDSIYDTPPIHDGEDQSTVPMGHTDDSLYDVPPASELRGQDFDSIYDVPPPNQQFGNQEELYDLPPRTRMAESLEEQTSPADLFNFGFNVPPRVDRSLKYASTGTALNMPPPIDRKTRPVLTASVPSFPTNIERACGRESSSETDNIYDAPPRSAGKKSYGGQTHPETQFTNTNYSQQINR